MGEELFLVIKSLVLEICEFEVIVVYLVFRVFNIYFDECVLILLLFS